MQVAGKIRRLGIEESLQLCDFRKPLGQVVERGIGRVAVIALLIAPVIAGFVFILEHPAHFFQ